MPSKNSPDNQPRGSWIENLDPRAQLAFYVCLIVGILVSSRWHVLIVLSIVAFLVALAGKISWRHTRQAWYWLLTFIIIVVVLNLLYHRSSEYIIANTLKLFGVFSATLAFMSMIDPRLCSIACRRLGAPDKIAYTITLIMRYIPTLIKDYCSTRDAQMARGLELERHGANFLTRLRKVAPLLIPVLIQNIAESEDVINSMEQRAFGTRKRRTWLRELHFKRRDVAVTAAGFLLLASCVMLKWIIVL